jgi:hypothetical protein
MYPELKFLGLRPVAKVVGFQKPCPLQSSRNGPRGPMSNQDRLAHHKGVVPHTIGSGRSVARTCRFSRLNLPGTATSLPTLCRAPSQRTGMMVGVSTHDGASSLGRMLSCCSTEQRGRQMRAEAPKGNTLPPGAEAPGLPRLKAVSL